MNCNVCRACDYRKLKSPRKLKFFFFFSTHNDQRHQKEKKKNDIRCS